VSAVFLLTPSFEKLDFRATRSFRFHPGEGLEGDISDERTHGLFHMKKITIVGAGLSGLTSAIILSKQGFEVEVLDKGNKLGGLSLLLEEIGKQPYVFADMTPFDIKGLSEYLGFDLGDFSSEPSKEKYYSDLAFARFYFSIRQV